MATDDLIGKIIDNRYRLTEVVGGGGMGCVYKAEDTKLHNRVVAIKVLYQNMSGGDLTRKHLRDRFSEEIRISILLGEHPRIIKVFDHGLEADQPYLVMEYLRGIDLSVLIKQKKDLDLLRIVRIATQICDGLHHAHCFETTLDGRQIKGVVHRDIKPSNIFILNERGIGETVKVLDFGVAKTVSDLSVSMGTQKMGGFIGTVRYASPEQLKGKVLDARSDIYSLGIVLYEMLTGNMPYIPETDSFPGWYEAHNFKDPRPFTGVGWARPIPPSLQAVVLDCLQKDPNQRPPSMQVLSERLESALSQAAQETQLPGQWVAPLGYGDGGDPQVAPATTPLGNLADKPPISPVVPVGPHSPNSNLGGYQFGDRDAEPLPIGEWEAGEMWDPLTSDASGGAVSIGDSEKQPPTLTLPPIEQRHTSPPQPSPAQPRSAQLSPVPSEPIVKIAPALPASVVKPISTPQANIPSSAQPVGSPVAATPITDATIPHKRPPAHTQGIPTLILDKRPAQPWGWIAAILVAGVGSLTLARMVPWGELTEKYFSGSTPIPTRQPQPTPTTSPVASLPNPMTSAGSPSPAAASPLPTATPLAANPSPTATPVPLPTPPKPKPPIALKDYYRELDKVAQASVANRNCQPTIDLIDKILFDYPDQQASLNKYWVELKPRCQATPPPPPPTPAPTSPPTPTPTPPPTSTPPPATPLSTPATPTSPPPATSTPIPRLSPLIPKTTVPPATPAATPTPVPLAVATLPPTPETQPLNLTGTWTYRGGVFAWPNASQCRVDVTGGRQLAVTISQDGGNLSASYGTTRPRSGTLQGNSVTISGKIDLGSPEIIWNGTVSPDGKTISGTATCKNASFPITLTRGS
ncbi:MAG: protein kinase [Cyanobacteriota bacterium]|nr:protein kinase [Cyanobacteriota bacterium]